MILGFMKTWKKGRKKGEKTFFVDKIWQSFDEFTFLDSFDSYSIPHKEKTDRYIEVDKKPKKHTIRKGDRWKAGRDIHFVINNRQPSYFQFAPVLKCVSVQKIKFLNVLGKPDRVYYTDVFIDDVLIGTYGRLVNHVIRGQKLFEKLVINDGFETIEDFFEYFDNDFEGQIVHWTELKY